MVSKLLFRIERSRTLRVPENLRRPVRSLLMRLLATRLFKRLERTIFSLGLEGFQVKRAPAVDFDIERIYVDKRYVPFPLRRYSVLGEYMTDVLDDLPPMTGT
jgi:hypothetical protein